MFDNFRWLDIHINEAEKGNEKGQHLSNALEYRNSY